MMRRLATLFLIVLAFAIVARPLLRGEVFTFRDHTDYFQPLRWFTAQSLRAGHLPLWNPYSASGEPWMANPQTAVFYPPAWLFLALPFATAYMLYLALHLALLGCGALLLFARRASPGAALIGAVALMFCGPTLSLLDVQNNLTTFAWLPLVIWCAAARVHPMWSAAAIAMSFLAGEPFFAAVGALIFAIVRRRGLLDVAAQSFALAAVQLLPFLAMLRGSDRAGVSQPDLREAMPLRDWLRIAVPPHLTGIGFDPALGQHFIPIVYVGIVTCALAAAGAIFAWRRLGGWLALLAASVLFAHLPLPLYRYPARLVPLGALAIVAMAVQGWDVALRFIRLRSLAVLVAVVVAIELVAVARPILATAPMRTAVPYAATVGRDAKIARLGDPVLVALNRRAWIGGYLNLYERRFDAWTAAPVVSRRYAELYTRAINDPTMSLLSEMSVRYLLTARGVFRNARARPLAYAEHGGPSFLAFGSSFIHAAIDVQKPSMMIVTQQRLPGWSVDVDGHRAALAPHGDFLAVEVPAGKHDVLFRYWSTSFTFGAMLTLLALARMLLPRSFVKR
ncbi:MAG TPA: hypothetical protein VG323_20465 [Thermoanaerobaculia bacterium]|nr:hypothetical protein [Thermoanaerobaculia bacterium]